MTTYIGRVLVHRNFSGVKDATVETSQRGTFTTDASGYANVVLDDSISGKADVYVRGSRIWSGYCSEFAGADIQAEY